MALANFSSAWSADNWMGMSSKDGDQERFDFTWDGNDECDEASGSGWLKLNGKTGLTGHIKLHHGDRSGLVAVRMK